MATILLSLTQILLSYSRPLLELSFTRLFIQPDSIMKLLARLIQQFRLSQVNSLAMDPMYKAVSGPM